jgi:hypothetical protein
MPLVRSTTVHICHVQISLVLLQYPLRREHLERKAQVGADVIATVARLSRLGSGDLGNARRMGASLEQLRAIKADSHTMPVRLSECGDSDEVEERNTGGNGIGSA